MPNPTFYTNSAPHAIPPRQQKQEHQFKLYMSQIVEGTSGTNQLVVANNGRSDYFGITVAMDWVIRDDLGPKANIVAHAKGLHVGAGTPDWFTSFTIKFMHARFKESTLMVQGIFGNSNIDVKGEWAIVGGTGQFAYAQGVVLYKQLSDLKGIVIRELEMHVLCPIFPKPSPVIKEGQWGGNDGTAYELPGWELPHRLQTVTVHGDGVIDSIAFTYVDEAGTKRSVGPFGGDGGVKNPPIILGPSETLREIYGTTGDYGGYTEVVTSLTIITSSNSVRTYGNQSNGKKSFRIAKDNHNIVGFYGRAGGFVDQIGAYLRPN